MIPKYRMWNEITSRLHSVDRLCFDSEAAQYKDEVGVSRFIKFKNAILMQSTGLLDKNDKEIFEGDVVKNGKNVMCMKRHDTLGFYVEQKGEVQFIADGMDLEEFEEDAKEIADSIEIIGNIYENPELLEVE